MRQTTLVLKAEDREKLQMFRSQGRHHAREVNRAHILLVFDRKIPKATIQTLLGVGRTAIWRTRSAYCERGLDYALHDVARPGAPRDYRTAQEAKVVALACSQSPPGAKRWTLRLLTQAARKERGLRQISRESVRRFLRNVRNRGSFESHFVIGRFVEEERDSPFGVTFLAPVQFHLARHQWCQQRRFPRHIQPGRRAQEPRALGP